MSNEDVPAMASNCTWPDNPGTIEYCTDLKAEHPENIVNATIAGRSAEELARILDERRQVTTNSSCGLCGRLTIESLRVDAPAISIAWTIAPSVLVALP